MRRLLRYALGCLLLFVLGCTSEPAAVQQPQPICSKDIVALDAEATASLETARTTLKDSPAVALEILKPLVAEAACTKSDTMVEVWHMIGDKHLKMRNIPEALRAYQAGLGLLRRVHFDCDSNCQALGGELYYNCSNQFARLGAQDSAIWYARAAIEAKSWRYGSDAPEVAASYSALAQAYQNQQKYRTALKFRLKVLRIRQASGKTTERELAYAWFNLADAYIDVANYDSVDYCLQEVLHLVPALPANLSTKFSLNTQDAMARLHIKRDDYASALQAVDDWFAMAKATQGASAMDSAKIYLTKGQIELQQGENDAALQSFHSALLLHLPAAASPDWSELPAVDRLGTDPNVFIALALKGHALLAHPDTAISQQFMPTMNLAFQFFDGLRRGFWQADVKADVSAQALPEFEMALRAAVERHATATAFEWLERAKENELLDILQDLNRLNLEVIPKDTLALGQRFQDLARTNLAYNDSLNILKAAIRKAHPGQLRPQPQFADIDGVRAKLQGDSAMFVSYFWGTTSLIVAGITTTRDTLLSLPITPALRRAMQQFRKEIQINVARDNSIGPLAFAAASLTIHDAILQPLFDALTAGAIPKRLIISPHGELAVIPFEALTTAPAAKAKSWRKLPYLLHATTISYVQSGTIFVAYDSVPPIPNGVLGIGATGGYRDTRKLEGVAKEVAAIVQRFGGLSLIDQMNAERIIKTHEGLFGILHIAAHGKYAPDAPLQSKLYLPEDPVSGEDGDLHAYEVLHETFAEKMAVLSACETGPGKPMAGHEVMSMGYAFEVARCSTVVMSLWNVDDGATSAIMEGFYAQLADGKRSADAFAAARRDYVTGATDDPHPSLWAAWLMAGNGELQFVAAEQTARPLWIWFAMGGFPILLSLFLWRRRVQRRKWHWT